MSSCCLSAYICLSISSAICAWHTVASGSPNPGCGGAEQPAAVRTKDGFVALFDGRSLNGWIQRGGSAKYHVEDNMIVGTTVPDTPNSFLCTKQTFADFELELEFQIDASLNSGVQIRSQSRPDYKNGRVHGYQVEIDPSERAWTGGIYDEGRRGWLFDLKENTAARQAFMHNRWNHLRIVAKGESIKTWLNGVPAADLIDGLTTSGFIALQVHSTKSETPLQVRWRNIQIKVESSAPDA